jgi:hypothetical protein
MPIVLALLGLLTGTPALRAAAQEADPWTPLRFLIGTWEGESTGQPGSGTVRREYRLVLRDRYIEVRNTSTYPPQEKNPKGEVHEDIGYISIDRGRDAFVLRQFHVEGFVNTFLAEVRDEATIAFTTESIENIPAGWRARELYRMNAPDELVEVFELAGPGKDFTLYSQTRLRRVR